MFYKFLFTKDNFSALSKVDIVSFSYTELNKEPSILHAHPFCEIVIPENPFGYLLYNGRKIEVKSGCIYVINPHITHSEINRHPDNTASNQMFKYYVIKINHVIFKKTPDNELICIEGAKTFWMLRNYLKNAYDYAGETDKSFTILNLACFYHAFLKLLADLGYTVTNVPRRYYSSLTQEVEYFISKNYNADIALEKLAAAYGVSHNALTRRFKAETGYTPKEYLLITRITAAKSLLSSTDMTISSIAYNCGFSSAAYFSLQFKKHEKYTPKEYRMKSVPFRNDSA